MIQIQAELDSQMMKSLREKDIGQEESLNIQYRKNTSVPVTSLAYLKAFPSQPTSLFTATSG